jgi:Zn-dependent protease
MSFQLLIGAVTAVTLFVNVLIHEPGHSVVGLRYKIPVHSIAPFISGGVAQIGEEPPSAIAEFLIASAGPSIGDKMLAVFRHHFKPSAGLGNNHDFEQEAPKNRRHHNGRQIR